MLYTVAKSTDSNVICSKNALYYNVRSTIQMSTSDSMTCSENVAYASMQQDNNDEMRASLSSNIAVYDEVSPRK